MLKVHVEFKSVLWDITFRHLRITKKSHLIDISIEKGKMIKFLTKWNSGVPIMIGIIYKKSGHSKAMMNWYSLERERVHVYHVVS